MPQAPITSRRWLQFRLRGLAVGLTLVALAFAWLAYNLSWLRQRRAVIADFPNWIAVDPLPNAPGLLRIFGEKGYGLLIRRVFVDQGTPDDVREEVRRVEVLFPESSIELDVFSKDDVEPLSSRSMH